MNPTVHLCLVSDQPTPNITPALDRSFRPKRVILLVSPEKQRQAQQIRQVLQPSGIRVSLWQIDDAMDVEHIRLRVLELLQPFQNNPAVADDIALNATGGTKPMSIAAYEVFRDYGLPIFYVHPGKDRLIWMHPSDRVSFALEDRIHLPQFFQAHGVEVEPGKMNRTILPDEQHQLSVRIIGNLSRLSKALGTLNYLANKAEGSLRVTLSQGERSWSELTELIGLFADCGWLSFDGEAICFDNEKSRFFVNGGWLEQHVMTVVHQIRNQQRQHIHDLAQGLVVNRGGVRNELDVVFLNDNSLYLIECKTGDLVTNKGVGGQVVYKLDSLTDDLGGLRARAMLVSCRHLKKADLERAKQAGIRICSDSGLKNLQSVICQWLA
ncbi:MAG TPA: DUF1887 family protein [Gammaproteobacteria bacterium]|nr:DUF1887 family protein [Gammaproteobacteria bacterium]